MAFRIDDRILATDALRRRLLAEAQFEEGPGTYWGVSVREGVLLVPFKSADGIAAPMEDQQMFANDMAHALNKHLHHDGAWLVLFTHPMGLVNIPIVGMTPLPVPYDRWVFLWMDADGDVQFSMDNVEEFAEVLLAGPDHWMEEAERAWQTWKLYMRDVLDVRQGETFKRALGEVPTSAKLPRGPASKLVLQ